METNQPRLLWKLPCYVGLTAIAPRANRLARPLASPIAPTGDRVVTALTVTQFVLYSKPGCHLCEGLEEKLVAAAHLAFELEVRDMTTRDDWFQRYQYEIPVLCQVIQGEAGSQEMPLPRLSPRAPQARVEQLIQTYMGQSTAE